MWSFHFSFVSVLVQVISRLAMGGNDHCCAVGCRNHRGMVDDEEMPLSFHTFPKDPDCRLLWVARMNRADLRFQDIFKYTVLCSKHFVDGEKTLSNPHPVFAAHKTYPSKRRKPQLTFEVRSATSVTGAAKRRLIAPGKEVFQCKSLKDLALDAFSAQQ